MQHNLFISNFKRIIAMLVFALCFFGACFITQGILKDKYLTDATTIVNGFYAEEKNSIDVICIGSSNCFCTINPMVLYENYGIAAYDFASSSQTVNISLLYLKEALKRQNPKVVALEVNYIPQTGFQEVSESSLLWGLTDIPFSIDKMKCISQCRDKFNGEYMSYLFPILRYHSRWKDLYKTDFVYAGKDKTCFSKGYMGSQEIYSEELDFTAYDEEGYSWVEDEIVECLDEMHDLCRKNGVELILFKSPREDWYGYQSMAIRELADARNIPFVDYNILLEELGINRVEFFRDYKHLNDAGACIVSDHFGRLLKEYYELPDRRLDENENSWDKAMAYYNRLQEPSFTAASTVKECYQLINQQENYATIITYRGGVNQRTKEKVNPHQWVYQNHNLVLEQEWKRDGTREISLGENELVLHCAGQLVQVLIGNLDYEVMSSDWSVVVYDEITHQVVANLKFEE